MSDSHGIQPGELRDRSGRLLGTFVTVEEAARAEAEVRELKAALARLEDEKARIETALKAHLRAKIQPMTAEEIADLDANGFTAAQLREEIERQFAAPRRKEAS